MIFNPFTLPIPYSGVELLIFVEHRGLVSVQ
jgi:hypothetical protein